MTREELICEYEEARLTTEAHSVKVYCDIVLANEVKAARALIDFLMVEALVAFLRFFN